MRVTTRTFPDPQNLCPVPVTEYTLQNDHGISVSCINYGAIITDVRMPDRNGLVESIVLRFPDLTGYIAHAGLYLGAIVGRTAGRIDGASFPLNGAMYALPKNDGENSLHGNGEFSKAIWDAEVFDLPDPTVCDHRQKVSVTFLYTSPAGSNGFPGEVHAEVTYLLDNNDRFHIEYLCQDCGSARFGRELPRLLHWFDIWTSNGDGTHSAACKREGCDHTGSNKCEFYEVTIGETTYSVCPVCGDGVFEIVEGALIEGENLPKGEAIIRGAADPFEGVLYAFTAGYEYSGDMEAFIGAVKVSLPVSVEGEFKLMFAGEEELTEIAYTVEEGVLSFETETAGLYLIVPVVEEAVEVEEAA